MSKRARGVWLGLVVGWMGAAGCAEPGGEPEARVEALIGGVRDLSTNDGVFHDTPAQWHRDATVQLEPSGCGGVLVAPNVVLSAAHCFFRPPERVLFGIRGRRTDAANPDATIPLPAGTPSTFEAGVLACISHPGSGLACGIRGAFSSPPNDVAILILDQRIDHGELGTRTQNYHAIPADIVPADPACPASLGLRSNLCWDGASVSRAAFGPTEGCLSGEGLSWPRVRQRLDASVYFGQWPVPTMESMMLLSSLTGLPGDSGSPVFSTYDGYDDSRPLHVLAISSGEYIPVASPVCAPGPLYGDLHDIVTRLTDGGVQDFLATVLGVERGGAFGAEVVDYPGLLAPVTGGTWSNAPGVPPGFAVWTGDVDLPPSTEREAREAYGITHAIDPNILDPDGDGLVAAHDNCWGFYNPEQRFDDATRICCMNDGGEVEHASVFRVACVDACPQPATSVDRALDCDGDLLPDVCEDDADGDSVPDACDNCIDTRNFDQSDCNADAVDAYNTSAVAMGRPPVPVRGDACDPDPCGLTRVIERTNETSSALFRATDVAFDLLQVDARASVTTTARTGHRFCQCALAGHSVLVDSAVSRRQCLESRGGSGFNGGCGVNDLLAYDAPSEHRPWRRISVTTSTLGGTTVTGAEDTLRFSAPRPGSFSIDRAGYWRLLDVDIPRWSGLDGIAETFAPFVTEDGLAGAVSGVVWTHVPGSGALRYDVALRHRTSHYWSGEIPRPYRTIPRLPRLTILTPLARGWDWHGTLPFVADVAAFREHEAGPILIQSGFGIPRTPLVEFFDHEGVWVAASEPSGLLPETGIRHVAITSGGVVSVVLAERSGTLVDADDPACVQCPDRRSYLAPRDGLASLAGPQFSEIDTAASGVWVLSSVRRQLWRVGSATSTTSASLATYDVGSSAWAVRSIEGVGEVLAAVYSPREDVIWVVDQVSEAGPLARSRLARLLALHPGRATITVAAQWTRITSFDRFALALDPAGRLYVAGGDRVSYAVVLVDPSLVGVEVVGVRFGLGALVPHMIRANASEVALATELGWTSIVARHPSSDFGSAGGGLGSCL